jgi:hypothetical protein
MEQRATQHAHPNYRVATQEPKSSSGLCCPPPQTNGCDCDGFSRVDPHRGGSHMCHMSYVTCHNFPVSGLGARGWESFRTQLNLKQENTTRGPLTDSGSGTISFTG